MRYIYGLFILVCLTMAGEAFGRESGVIKVGMTVSMTGPFSQEVGPFKGLIKGYQEALNSKGGISIEGRANGVEFVVYDDRSDQNTVRAAYERLIRTERVDVLLGPYSSPLTFAASMAAEENQVPFLAICGNSPKIYERGYRWLAGILDIAPNYTIQYWDMLREERAIRTVAFVVEDSMHPKGVYNGARDIAQKYGFEILHEEIVSSDTKDFSALIIKLKNKNPDLVFVSSNIPFGVAFMKNAKEKGLSPKEYHVIHNSGIFKKALGDFAENVVGQMYWVEGMKTKGSEEFIRLCNKEKIDPYDYPWAVTYFAAFQVLQEAITRAGSRDRDAIINALKKAPFETILGKDQIGEKGYGMINPIPAQIQNNRYEIVWPPGVSTKRHIYRR